MSIEKDYAILPYQKFVEKYVIGRPGRCRVCGRPIYSGISLVYGIGGVCRRKVKAKKYYIPGQIRMEE